MTEIMEGLAKRKSITSKRILVVDDEPLVCDAVKMMLGFDGHKATSVNRAKDALVLLDTSEFDLVITDFAMPGMQGNELASLIKAQRPNLPVVMITAYAEMLDAKKDSLQGVDCLVSKPFMIDDLRRAISESISKY